MISKRLPANLASIVIALSLLANGFAMLARAETITSQPSEAVTDGLSLSGEVLDFDNFKYMIKNDGTICIAGYTGSEEDVVIPSKIEGIPVTEIGNGAFNLKNSIKTLTLPDTLTKIGMIAFSYCQNMESINIPSSVTVIENGAFMGCESLTEVVFPPNLTEISSSICKECKSLTNVVIPFSVKTIRNGAFDYCFSLEAMTIPDTVTLIESGAICWSPVTVRCLRNSAAYNYVVRSKQEGYPCYDGLKYEIVSVIEDPYKKSIADWDITLSQTTYTYTGKSNKPAVTVKEGTRILEEGTDYKVQYNNTVDEGTANVVVTGIGDYTGSKTLYYTIVTLSDFTVNSCKITLSETHYIYDGTTKFPTITVVDEARNKTLKKGEDYSLIYYDATGPGTAQIEITGKGRYTGKVVVKYTIEEIEKIDISECSIVLSENTFYSDGTAKRPEVRVHDNSRLLVQDTDYTVVYKYNFDPGLGKVIISGIGEYTGSKELTFSIKPPRGTSISDCAVTVSPLICIYDGLEKTPSATVKYGDVVLNENIDYTVSYSENVDVGTACLTVKGIGYYTGSVSTSYKIYYEGTELGYLGDLDNDSEITAADALTILRSSVGMTDLKAEQTKLADIDGDEQITANDALAVLRYSVGMGEADSPINKPIAA